MGTQHTGRPSSCGGSVETGSNGSADVVRPLDVPVVRSDGLFGNVRRFAAAPPEFLTRNHEKYGDTVYIPFAPKFGAYSFRSPRAIQDIVLDLPRRDPDALIKGKTYAWVRRDVGLALFNADLDEHRWRRAVLNPGFSNSRVHERSTKSITAAAQVAVDTLRSRVGGGETIDMRAVVSEFTIRVIGELTFGFDFGDDAKKIYPLYVEAEEVVNELMGRATQFLPAWLPSRVNRRASRLSGAIGAQITGYLRRWRQSHEPCLLDDMIDSSQDRYYDTDRRVLDECRATLGAGFETTAAAISWALYFIAGSPAVQEKLYTEITRGTAQDPAAASPADDSAGARQISYLDCVINESLRLMPPAWGILREARKDVVIDGVKVPKGALVFATPYATHRDPRYFDDPLAFRPERHLQPNWPRFAYYPFSYGARACIGRALAELESRALLAALLREFRFERYDALFVEPVTRITVKPKDALNLRLIPRA